MPLTKWEALQKRLDEQQEEHRQSIKKLYDTIEAEHAARKTESESLLASYDKKWEERLAKAAEEEEAAMRTLEIEGESDDETVDEEAATKTRAKPKPKAPAEEGYTCPVAGCGAPIEEDAKRCGACGSPLKW